MKEVFKSVGTKLAIGAACIAPITIHSACSEEALNTFIDIAEILLDMMGYKMEDEQKYLPDNPDTDVYDENEDGTLKSKVDWSSYAPPIGNQGSYGTCVAWATGYGLKTTLNGIEKKNTSYAKSAANQTSPIDLWHVLGSNYSNSIAKKCEGSSFDPAFKALINYGAQSMSAKPFTGQKMTCDGVKSSGNPSNKLGEYRVIAYTNELSGKGDYGMNPNNIKYYLQKGPVVVGAKLGERFMYWNNSNVITNDSPESYSGGHAYHAMMVVGYDDSKQAFRLQNSWGASEWGDNGYIWVGYNFFFTNFAFGVWAASNSTNTFTSSSANSSLRSASGNDLELKVLREYAMEEGVRAVDFDVRNVGGNSVDLDDVQIALVMYRGRLFSNKAMYITTNLKGSLSSGESAAENAGKKCLTLTYNVPTKDLKGYAVEGGYNMFMAVDAKDNLSDDDKSNNFAFITGAGYEPFQVSLASIEGKTQILHEDLANKSKNNHYGADLMHRLAK